MISPIELSKIYYNSYIYYSLIKKGDCMIRCVNDSKYDYQTIFNTKTGAYIRFSDKPMASFPHLIDVGVMG